LGNFGKFWEGYTLTLLWDNWDGYVGRRVD
jgi:hypothetical protein